MNEEVKKEENTETVVSVNGVENTADSSSSDVVGEATADTPSYNKDEVNIAPITKPTVHFESKKPEEEVSEKKEEVENVNAVVESPSQTEATTNAGTTDGVAQPADLVQPAPAVSNPQEGTPTPVEPNKDNGGEFIEKEKKRWPIILLLILLVLGGAFYYYYFIMTKPSTLFNKVVNASYTKLSNNVSTNLNNVTKNFSKGEFTGKLILTSENANLVMVNGLTVNTDFQYDKDNKKAYVSGSGSLLGIEIANAKIMLDGDYVYFNIKKDDVQSETYKTKIDTSIITTVVENDDLDKYVNSYKYLLDKAKNTFLANVSENKITKTPELKDVDGKKVPAYKINYTYDESENNKILKAILNAYMNDNKSLEELVTLGLGGSIDDVKTSLKDMIDEENSTDTEKFETINFIIYIDMFNSNLLGFNVSRGQAQLNVKVSGNNYTVVMTSKEEKSTDTVSLTYDSNENRYVLDVDTKSIINSIMEEVKANTDSNYVKTEQRNKFSIVYKEKKINDKKIEYSFSFKYFEPTNSEKEMVVIDATGEFNVIDKVKTFDITNAIDYDSLDENAKKKILSSLIGSEE